MSVGVEVAARPPEGARRVASRRATAATAAGAIAAGVLIALSLPPFGLWPLGIAGLAVWYRLVEHRPAGPRFLWSLLVASTWLAIGISWFAEFSLPGYLLAVLVEAAIVALAGLATPRRELRWLAFPAAFVLAEALRSTVPFGGIPLAGVDLGQAGGPLAPAARLGGRLLVSGLAALAGAGLAELAMPLVRRLRRGGNPGDAPHPPAERLVAGAVAVAGALTIASVGQVLPAGEPRATIDVAAVQGGGRRGFRATEAEAANVFRRHLQATATLIEAGERPDLVVWPEDVVDVPAEVTTTEEGDLLAALADRLDTTLVAGAVEDEGTDRFRNAVVAWGPDGRPVGRYEKVRRVPFGEYFPFRDVVERLADIPPRDAIPGSRPGFIDTPAAPLGFAISYEGFFPDRARAGIRAGGELLVIPTNAASFQGTIVPGQQLAAARLRAWETGRWVVQAGPTGYTAVIDERGQVLARTALSSQEIVRRDAELRTGRTPFVRWGDLPTLSAAAAVVAASWALVIATRRRRPT